MPSYIATLVTSVRGDLDLRRAPTRAKARPEIELAPFRMAPQRPSGMRTPIHASRTC